MTRQMLSDGEWTALKASYNRSAGFGSTHRGA